MGVQRAYNSPEFPVIAISLLHQNMSCIVRFRGSAGHSFIARRGVKQGRPLSGALFALALGPLLRRVASLATSMPKQFSAFADDLRLAAADIFSDLATV
eukprot:5377251-Pyramimonas_sp.AAC.1